VSLSGPAFCQRSLSGAYGFRHGFKEVGLQNGLAFTGRANFPAPGLGSPTAILDCYGVIGGAERLFHTRHLSPMGANITWAFESRFRAMRYAECHATRPETRHEGVATGFVDGIPFQSKIEAVENSKYSNWMKFARRHSNVGLGEA
jgi:hypothetical protein